MPPIRTHPTPSNHEVSSLKRKHHTNGKHRRQNNVQKASDVTPGIQKIKAALRQTKRLLAKDKLAANVRVETERRLKALEADLHSAELSKKERTFAVRYHKIKFFERQKVTRKIRQTQRRLEASEQKSERKRLKAELAELRTDLNYILHFPKFKKYISLFPPEIRKGEEDTVPISPAETQNTETEREEIRSWIRTQMELKELPGDPETTQFTGDNPRGRSQNWPSTRNRVANKVDDMELTSRGLDQDDFFGEDEDEASHSISEGND
ncbi:hypothetical protein CPB83DRAFT_852126 [Crepidotus variabilis]|uniref:rRNA-processing protein EFG1 n=1 Tax=Crepidotus variabilis TaxID=179855 RepID=A0A9P6JQZ8_9AGAR|nr:hypothetical protein CPB83DRAFT_852126 [Crepidotus variabilis]